MGVVLVAGCGDGDGPTGGVAGVNLGSGDVGVLNYAYALEQLEADFYTRVVATPYAGITTAERNILTDIRDCAIVHREFLKAALRAGAIGILSFDFASVNFSSRASVLGTAKVLEDLGVGAYNGAGQLLADAHLLSNKPLLDSLDPELLNQAGDRRSAVGGLDPSLQPQLPGPASP